MQLSGSVDVTDSSFRFAAFGMTIKRGFGGCPKSKDKLTAKTTKYFRKDLKELNCSSLSWRALRLLCALCG